MVVRQASTWQAPDSTPGIFGKLVATPPPFVPTTSKPLRTDGWSTCSDLACRRLVARTSRRLCSSAEVPEHFLRLLFLIEDKRFGVHFGVDPLSIIRAASANLLANSRSLQGASTITQQLFDIYKLQHDPDYSRPRVLRRKLVQAKWSLRKEIRASKADILRFYLDHVYWGRDYYGIDAASQGYFASARFELSVAQSFFLAERLACPNGAYAGRLQVILARPVVRQMVAEARCGGAIERIYSNWQEGQPLC